MRPIDVDHKLRELEDRIRSLEKDSTALSKNQATVIHRCMELTEYFKNSFSFLAGSIKGIINDPKNKELN